MFLKVGDHLRVVRIQDADGNVETIQTTDEHPFFLAGPGGGGAWVAAKNLRAGDRLGEADGSDDSRVLSSTREDRPDGVAVYNFEVEGDHTYFVEDGLGAATRGDGAVSSARRTTVSLARRLWRLRLSRRVCGWLPEGRHGLVAGLGYLQTHLQTPVQVDFTRSMRMSETR